MGGSGKCLPGSHNSRPFFTSAIRDTKLIFLEFSFDPINRIKRGKFYKMADEGQPANIYPILCIRNAPIN